jgi:ATP-dependent DNA helicase RecG
VCINTTPSILNNPIEYITGVSTLRGDMLRKELQLFTFNDVLNFFPFRHVDKTKVETIASLSYQNEYAQVAGKLTYLDIVGEKRSKRLVAHLQDATGEIELVWFQGINWVQKTLQIGGQYVAFGKLGFFLNSPQIAHPEIEIYTPQKAEGKAFLEPIYSTTEKLKARGLNARAMGKITFALLQLLKEKDLPENLPQNIIDQYKFISRYEAYHHIHFPTSDKHYLHAVRRIKFEELFFAQLRLGLLKTTRHRFSKGESFEKLGTLFNTFYNQYLPFQLTNAQKKVVKEIRKDVGSGKHMNRLLQGDVGSGKTIVALIMMLIAADNTRQADGASFQSVLMAPTEILAQQHYIGITTLLKDMPVVVHLLTGSTKTKERRLIAKACEEGSLHILIGTHAVLEDKVKFKNLGFVVIDEQHKFGVAQRAQLWKKSILPPHILVMTATPIPRTLALTAYGDLDYSVIDELPPGRQPINTIHRNESARPQVMSFVKDEILKGRQAYIVYPLIEESSTLDYENLMKGFEEVKSFFPEPKYWISMVHGKQPAAQKEENMQRFVKADTQILVSTTVIEVGVNVPNASVMVIESAEKFGLSQLHQLRGRVGRGAEKSYCILLTGAKVSKDAKERLKIMVATNDGFKIAEKDLEIRGPGDIEGTRQSGLLNFKLANIVQDKVILEAARDAAEMILDNDPDCNLQSNACVKDYLNQQKGKTAWSKIS